MTQQTTAPAEPTAATASGGAVTLTGISKTWGDFTAVQPLDLTIPEGSFFALLGASGCGKTTTLRMIAGLEEPTSGTVRIGDLDATELPPHKRPVNTVFQNYALFPHLDIYENVAFGLRRRGIKSVKKQVEEMLELVELGHLARRKPHQLSGGQQQRVAVARALVTSPDVIFADEPTGALDTGTAAEVLGLLRHAVDTLGATVVMVTHDPTAAAWADRVLFLADGIFVDGLEGGSAEQIAARMTMLAGRTDAMAGVAA